MTTARDPTALADINVDERDVITLHFGRVLLPGEVIASPWSRWPRCNIAECRKWQPASTVPSP